MTVLHERPAVIQEFEWRPRYFSSSGEPANDAVAVMTFTFYDNQLFRIVADYEDDLVEALTTAYGPASRPAAGTTGNVPSRHGIPDKPIATWGNADHSVTLLRVIYPETFRIVLTHTQLEQFARTAAVEAARLDADAAPLRELARRKKEAADEVAVREELRIENKAVSLHRAHQITCATL